MADQGIWFKLWTTALHDPDLANLSLEDFARWALLGTYIKAHGTAGRLRLTAPARALCGLLQVPDFPALQTVFERLPNVIEEREENTVSSETTVTVSYRNWLKYQGDYSTSRVRKFREMKRSKRRGEEKENKKRGEEKPTQRGVCADPAHPADSAPPPSSNGFDPDTRTWLLATKHLKPLADDKHADFWSLLVEAYDRYPWLYFEQEIAKADAWIETNPSRAPTPRGLRRFMRTWMNNAAEYGRKQHG